MSEPPRPSLMSPDAAGLYAHIIQTGIPMRADAEATGSALVELECLGLVTVSQDLIISVAPSAEPLGRLLAQAQRGLLDAHRALLDDFAQWTRAAQAAGTTGTEAVTVLHTPDSVEAVATELITIAAAELRSIDLPVNGTGAKCARMICTAAGAAECPPVGTDTVDCRVISDALIPMIVVDDAALLTHAERVGSGSALLIRIPVLVAILARHFDLLWEQAEPMPGREREAHREWESGRITRTQQAILTLLMAGLSDDGIARSLAISDRSVRRHIAALEERAGVTSRFALGARAVRLGWLPM